MRNQRSSAWLSLLICSIHSSPQVGVAIQVTSLRSLSKSFASPSWLPFQSPHSVQAIHPLSLNLTSPFLTLVGASGSGKSTLAKVMAGIELPSSGSIQRNPADDDIEPSAAYLDQHFYLTYNTLHTSKELLASVHEPIDTANPLYTPSLLKALQLFAVPDDEPAQRLLTSQRRVLEISLALYRLPPSPLTPLLVLDEYLDKDLSSSIRIVKLFLGSLVNDIGLQVVVVTHARVVLEMFNEDVLAMNKGRLFSRGSFGDKDKTFSSRVSLPSQLILI